jgi:hypothetical protein
MPVQIIVKAAAIAGRSPDRVPTTVPTLTISPIIFSGSVRWGEAMALFRWLDHEFALCDESHDVHIVRVRRIERDERGHAVDVNADANVLSVFVNPLGV